MHDPRYTDWAGFSHFCQGIVCKICSIMEFTASKTEQIQLITVPLVNFKNLSAKPEAKDKGKLDKHMMTARHARNMESAKAFIQSYESPETSLEGLMARQSAEDTCGYSSAVKSIIRSMIFLAKQGLALRGHREDIGDDTKNNGNFLELVKLIAQTDSSLNKHLSSGPRNAMYLSPAVQNKVIDITAGLIKKDIKKRMGNGPFGIIFDETTDQSTTEQICFVLRYFFNSTWHI